MGTLSHITMDHPCADMDPFGAARILQQQRSSDGTGLVNPNILNIYLIYIYIFEHDLPFRPPKLKVMHFPFHIDFPKIITRNHRSENPM